MNLNDTNITFNNSITLSGLDTKTTIKGYNTSLYFDELKVKLILCQFIDILIHIGLKIVTN